MNGLANSRARNIVALWVAVWVLGSTVSAAPVPLTNGVPVSGLSGTIGSETFYTIVVPAGQDDLEIQISGGSGDCDLYVRRNAAPTLTAYDYRPYQVGNNETVTVESPAAGTWYIMLRGYTAYSGLTLVATYSASISITPLTNGLAVADLAGAIGSETFYKIDVPVGQTKLEIQISGGSGDCDLYVKRDALPTTAVYDYRPYLVGNNELVTIDNPTAGTWYIMLRGYNAYAGVTLRATYTGGLGIALTNGVPVVNLTGTLSSEALYRIDVPAGQGNLEIKISGGSGDCDLYVKYGTPPTVSSFDYRPFLAGNEETVTVSTPTAGAWYIMLRGYSTYAGVTLVASYGSVVTLENGVAVPNLAGVLGSEKIFKIDLPSGETEFEISIAGGTGNCDLYVRRGLRPTVSEWDYRPYLSGNNETVSITNPQGGPWYIMLRARLAYTGVTLRASHAFVGNVTLLSNGVPVTNTSGAEGSKKYYRIGIPSDQTELEIKIFGGTGDADLYVSHGDGAPTLTEYDYRPYLIGNDETVTIPNPTLGNWLIMVHGYHAYTGLTVVATHTENGGGGGGTPTVTPLSNGVPVIGLAGAAGSQSFYKIDVPAGQSTLDIQMSGGTGDADMYIRKDQMPTLTAWDHRPYLIGNNEAVTINTPAAGTYYIMLNAYQAYTGVALVATYVPLADPVTELANGVPVTGLSGAVGSETFFKIVVPAGQDTLDFQMSGGAGDADMYIKKGAKPSTTSWDYRPYLIGNNETVHLDNPAAATWYVMIKAYQAYSGVSLVATYGVTAVGNNFAVDPNCVALWRFDEPNMLKDSIGTNTLTNHNGVTTAPLAKQGTASANFERDASQYLSITDAALNPGFPLKSGDTNKKISVCVWVRMEESIQQFLFAKDGLPGGNSFVLAIQDAAGQRYATIRHGYDNGNSYEGASLLSLSLIAGEWYHIAGTYNDADRSYRIRVYDPVSDTAVERTGTFLNTISVTNAEVRIGGTLPSTVYYADCLMDEMVVFNDILTAAEIDKIRQGTYGKP
jgi:hypothetical protein